MSVHIIECPQGSPEWFDARKGIPTASKFATIMSSPSGRGEMPIRTRYLYELAAEIVTGKALPEGYKSAAMERGNEQEVELRSAFALVSDYKVRQVGFVINDGLIKGARIGASPDSLIDPDGGLEIKSENPATLLKRIFNNEYPTEHMLQVQGNMWVCERDHWEVAIGWPGLPFYRATVKRDDSYIARLRDGVHVFVNELNQTVERIRGL